MWRIARWLIGLIGVVALSAFAAFVLGDAWLSRSLPELEHWHRVAPEGEVTAEELFELDFAGYRAREDRLFRRLDEQIGAEWSAEDPRTLNRFRPGSVSNPKHAPQNYNRSYELTASPSRGAALLVHGLSDSPYSMRALADVFQRSGYSAVVLRLPGHGTVPVALDAMEWRVWAAAVSMAAKHAKELAGPSGRIFFVGYSTGASLALGHVVDELLASGTTPVDGLFLFSPSLGVTPLARFANLNRVLSHWKPFEKARWLDVQPEYDPYKYNSFPKNAGRQSHLLTSNLYETLKRGAAAKLGEKLPALMAFQSIVDATVDVTAVEDLFQQLRGARHELVMFDINHAALGEGLLKPRFLARTEEAMKGAGIAATFTLVTNSVLAKRAVEARRWLPGATEPVVEPLEVDWPPYVFSLAHVAIPFPPDDPLYGASPMKELPLGRLNIKGERGVLMIPAAQLARLRHNPFFGYMERRIRLRIE